MNQTSHFPEKSLLVLIATMHFLACLQILSTIVQIAVFPIHLRFIFVLFSDAASRTLARSFRIFQLNITFLNSLFAILQISFHDFAFFGVASDFYMGQTWTANVVFSNAIILVYGTTFFHLLVGANQMTAVMFPFKHREIWRYNRVIASCVIAWILALLTIIPINIMMPVPFELNSEKQLIHNVRLVHFEVTLLTPITEIFPVIYLFASIVLQILTICCYAILFVLVRKSLFINYGKRSKVPAGVRKSCKFAAIISMGSLLTYSVLIMDHFIVFNNRDIDINEIKDDVLLTLAFTFKSAVTPLTMLAMFPKIRQLFHGRVATLPTSNSNSRRTHSTTATF